METRTAKLFKNGSSQAVRLPAEFRFEGREVYVTRDEATGDVVLSNHPGLKSWGNFLDSVPPFDDSPDFMAERPLNVSLQQQGVFDDTSVVSPK